LGQSYRHTGRAADCNLACDILPDRAVWICAMRRLDKAEHARSSGEKSDRSGHQTMDSGIMAERGIPFIGLGPYSLDETNLEARKTGNTWLGFRIGRIRQLPRRFSRHRLKISLALPTFWLRILS